MPRLSHYEIGVLYRASGRRSTLPRAVMHTVLADFPGDGYSTLCSCCEAIDSGPLITRARSRQGRSVRSIRRPCETRLATSIHASRRRARIYSLLIREYDFSDRLWRPHQFSPVKGTCRRGGSPPLTSTSNETLCRFQRKRANEDKKAQTRGPCSKALNISLGGRHQTGRRPGMMASNSCPCR